MPSPISSPRQPRTPTTNGNATPRSEIYTPRRIQTSRTSERDVVGPSDISGHIAPSSPYPRGSEMIDISSPMNYGTPSSMGSVRSRGGIRGTPSRQRPDIRPDGTLRQFNIAAENGGLSSELDAGPSFVIWGTDVVITQCKKKFEQFIKEFNGPDPIDDGICKSLGIDMDLPIYLRKLDQIKQLETPFFNLNCAHIEEFDAEFHRQVICYPQEVIPALDMVANEMFFKKYPAAVLEHQIQVRPFNGRRCNMRSLNPEDIDQLITVSGMVIRTSDIIPEIREALFKCVVCDFVTAVAIDQGVIMEPTVCMSCSTNHCFQIIHNRSQFTDKQVVKLQESQDDIPAGQTPHTIVLIAYSTLVDAIQAGERVTVTGIYRAVPIQVHPRMSNVRAVYRTYVDVVHYGKMDSKKLNTYTEDTKLKHELSAERIALLKALSKRDDIYDRLAHALAPSIYENEDIKKGILLQLFGGTRKTSMYTGRGALRSEINILLCGDPGTSKSQLLTYVYNLVPRSQYTSGKGSSAVGLTAYITKDPETRQLVLQPGALVLADNGVCCIDEFDKMNEGTRSVLHEVMEQQTLSIAKAGIICQLNARTSILAAANPCESQWNKNKTIIENIMLPHTLLSRFDLIFLILDPQSEQFDRRLACHLVSLYYKKKDMDVEETVDMDIMRDYLSYAKENVSPMLTAAATNRLRQQYVDMRMLGSGRGQITAYPRQLESLIRLAEAHAKMRFSQLVELQDVEEAYRLHREAVKQSATDPLSGKIDISILTTGLSASARQKKHELALLVKELLKGKDKGSVLNYQKFMTEVKEAAPNILITRENFESALRDLQDEGNVSLTSRTSIRII